MKGGVSPDNLCVQNEAAPLKMDSRFQETALLSSNNGLLNVHGFIDASAVMIETLKASNNTVMARYVI